MESVTWIQTSRGLAFNLATPKFVDVSTVDIANALGQICRFCGHTRTFYSVAEHSVRVADYVSSRCKVDTDATIMHVAALLHDAHEAYTGDITSPMKAAMERRCPGFKVALKKMVREINAAIVEALLPSFGPERKEKFLDLMEHDQLLLKGDLAMLHAERNQLLGNPPAPWPKMPPPALVTIEGWSPDDASHRFLVRLHNALIAVNEGLNEWNPL